MIWWTAAKVPAILDACLIGLLVSQTYFFNMVRGHIMHKVESYSKTEYSHLVSTKPTRYNLVNLRMEKTFKQFKLCF